MAYSPPNSFTNGNALTATALDGNDQALRVYLHDGVVDADLLSSTPWVETQHIQSPVVDPIVGLQHGVTGWQGSQWSGGFGVRAQFASVALTGNRAEGATTEAFEVLPQTAFTFELRHPALVIFHWWMETFNGPDDNVSSSSDASLYVGEYTESEQFATGRVVPTAPTQSLISSNNREGWVPNTSSPLRVAGPYNPYTIGGLGNLSGTVMRKVGAGGGYTVGLSHLTSIDPCCIINWSIHIEAYYTGINLN